MNEDEMRFFYRGIWEVIEIQAFCATSKAGKASFKIFMENLTVYFPCLKTCKPHLQNFLETHPYKNYEGKIDMDGNDFGYFEMYVDLRNDVNFRIGKPIYPFKKAWNKRQKIMKKIFGDDIPIRKVLPEFQEGAYKPSHHNNNSRKNNNGNRKITKRKD